VQLAKYCSAAWHHDDIRVPRHYIQTSSLPDTQEKPSGRFGMTPTRCAHPALTHRPAAGAADSPRRRHQLGKGAWNLTITPHTTPIGILPHAASRPSDLFINSQGRPTGHLGGQCEAFKRWPSFAWELSPASSADSSSTTAPLAGLRRHRALAPHPQVAARQNNDPP
jgi:hypothetical protein